MFFVIIILAVAAIVATSTVTDRRRRRAAGTHPQLHAHFAAADEAAAASRILANRSNVI